jgi:hypothetical protein
MAKVKARVSPDAPPPAREKVTLSLSTETASRLRAYAGYRREQMSDVVTRALERELKGLVISHGESAGS